MIITIGRECGCNGNKIGRALAEKNHIGRFLINPLIFKMCTG